MELSITCSRLVSPACLIFLEILYIICVMLLQSIVTRRELKSSGDPKACTEDAVEVEPESTSECTAIEMIGTNRPGIFSEISAVLAEQKCNIIEAHAWSHNACVACVAYVSDESTSTCIHDPSRLATIEDHLSTVLRPTTITDDEFKGAKTRFLGCDSSTSHKEHRLHQLMLANRDFDESPGSARASFSSMGSNGDEDGRRTTVSIDPFNEKGYSCVNVECPDRPKLMFDIVCTLTDLQYVIFHASITSHGLFAYQVCRFFALCFILLMQLFCGILIPQQLFRVCFNSNATDK